ncbi:hypothetical protein RHS04_07942 [Rhizoctonia solani]|uniref:Uncharacterized protein n=1 Tax=Rhizoctonia solani TaxID=456999 RepID=A0A8H7H4V2_9AGAM|nr:hypothetical protein RHS04_07942 [Rhizoctonia solani]
MPRNLTLDDYSPLIQYDSSWFDGNTTTHQDDAIRYYQNSTFRCTNVSGAKVTISFRGSAFYIYGAKRINHGLYQATVNTEPPMTGNGYPGKTDIYQTLLFGRSKLQDQLITVVLQNVPTSNGTWLDIDHVVITYERDIDNFEPVEVDNKNFTYSAQWGAETMSGYRTSIAYVTRTEGATATLEFQGSEITIYGGTGPGFGMFRVQVDDQAALTLNATREKDHPPTILVRQHNLTLTNLEDSKALAIDYATYISHTSSRSNPHVLSPGVIGGIVAGILTVLCIFALGWCLLQRGKYRYRGTFPISGSENTPIGYHSSNSNPITTFTGAHNQPPLGYVQRQPVFAPNVRRALVSRKSGARVGPVRPPSNTVLGSETQSSYESHSNTYVTMDQNDSRHSIHETDAGTLPPMYDQKQVFMTRPAAKNG